MPVREWILKSRAAGRSKWLFTFLDFILSCKNRLRIAGFQRNVVWSLLQDSFLESGSGVGYDGLNVV